MSNLSLPRIHFKGTFKANPPTANNDDVNDFVNRLEMGVQNAPAGMSDWQFRVYLMSLRELNVPGGAGEYMNAGWNYFGDGNVSFENTVTTSGMLAGGSAVPASDPILHSTVELLGNRFGDKRGGAIMVDLDSAGTFDTQIFANEFDIRTITPGGPISLLKAKYPIYCQSRWLNAQRNLCIGGDAGCSASWQFTVPTSALEFNLSIGSQGLQGLYNATQQPNVLGVMVLYTIYLVQPRISNQELAEMFKSGDFRKMVQNPAYGQLVGTIAPWYAGEMQTAQNGRLLYPQDPFTYTNPCASEKPKTFRVKGSLFPASLLETDLGNDQLQRTVGTAQVGVDTTRQVIILDLKTTLPEVDGNLEKYNFGALNVVVIPPGQSAVTVKQLNFTDYNEAAYLQSGGMIEVPYAGIVSDSDVTNGQIQIVQASSNATLVSEITYPNIVTDNRCTTINVGETATIVVQGFSKGSTPAANQPVTLQQYINIVVGQLVSTNNPTIIGLFEVGDPNAPAPATAVLNIPGQITLDSNGQYTLQASGIAPGVAYIRFYLPGVMPAQADPFMAWQFDFYACVRVLSPDDQFDSVPDSQLIGAQNWDYIYQNFFRYFYLIYPNMATRIDFTSYTACQKNAGIIKQFVAERNTSSTLYMPVTRELSDGRRRLIQRWCTLNG